MHGRSSRPPNLYGSCRIITSRWATTFYTSIPSDIVDWVLCAWCWRRSFAKTRLTLLNPFPLSLVFQWNSWNNSSLRPYYCSSLIWIWVNNSAKPCPTALLNFQPSLTDNLHSLYYFHLFSSYHIPSPSHHFNRKSGIQNYIRRSQ